MSVRNPYILFVIFFFWMFPPVLDFAGITLKTNYLFVFLLGLISVHLFFNEYKKSRYVKNIFNLLLVGFLYVLFVSLSSVIFFDRFDFAFVKDYIGGFLVIFSAFFIVKSYFKKYENNAFDKIIFHLFIIGFVHSLIVILVFFSEAFKDFLYSFIWVTEKQERYLFGDVLNVRLSGLLDTGFSNLSTTHGMLFCLGFVWLYYLKKRLNIFLSMIFTGFLATIFLSNVFIGRSGIILSLVFVFAFYIYVVLTQSIQGYVGKSNIYLLVYLLAGLLMVLVFIDFEENKSNLEFAFEIFINFYETGSLTSSSTETVLDTMMIFPNSGIGMLLGEMNFGRGEDSIPSDLGMVYIMNGVGIIGLLVMFLFYLPIIYSSVHLLKDQALKYVAFFVIFIILLSIILNFKDLYFVGFAGFFKILVILIFVLYFMKFELIKLKG
ncbi:MAG: hypothetical protein COW76_19680 [Shewanella sp. CG18_big_fil_WC_8_21_14_2_50_42_11]|uniref:hypothetical protein n=1 Tax=Shewanella TaxID=22 RepID=UPI000C5D1871|nr:MULTISPECIES: hypothetical protein [Shewanella]NCO69853.1 hypothetical protein [Shewanella vesiculosa]PIP98681.1 MAG: hypothetical protein COW76_19680 [Shewanella sp. CG18_big_fil_WC_8_21_14_2_50_42_11]